MRRWSWRLLKTTLTITALTLASIEILARPNGKVSHDLENDLNSDIFYAPKLSSTLPSRNPWKEDLSCKEFNISYLEPRSGRRCALASYPGSGSTWIRHLIEGATGVFTGSMYKDLQLQMRGYWGEIRDWRDGTTIVQKTHDADPDLVTEFGGRAILILRNPYDAILSKFHYLYGGHHGLASEEHFERPVWQKFVEVEMKDWLEMALNWTSNASPSSLHLVHYERMKVDTKAEVIKILRFLNLSENSERIKCAIKHKSGSFRRKRKNYMTTMPFREKMRIKIDKILLELNKILVTKRFPEIPLYLYSTFNKTDSELLHTTENYLKPKPVENITEDVDDEESALAMDGTKMLLEQYAKFFNVGDKYSDVKSVLDRLPMMSSSGTKVPKLLNMVVNMWPMIERGFKTDPIDEIVSSKISSPLDNLIRSLKTL